MPLSAQIIFMEGNTFMRRAKLLAPLIRAVAIIGTVGVLVSSATFAALQSQQVVLAGNVIKSANADLRIGTSASSFGSSRTGFEFGDIIPGGAAQLADGHSIYLKNYGSANLNLRLSVSSVPTNPVGVDLNKVFVHLTSVDSGAVLVASLQNLIDSYASNGLTVSGSIAAGSVAQYKLRASMAADAFSGSSASIGSIDFVFNGVAP
jgi:hypothetical protein